MSSTSESIRPDFAEFMSVLEAQDPNNPVMIDEDLWEEVFGGATARNGASDSFIERLERVTEQDLRQQGQDLYAQSCPVCQLSYAEILTEQEYAEAADHYVGGASLDLGLRRLPCRNSDRNQEMASSEHVLCGKCARKWLMLQNSCPMCRSIMDPTRARTTEGESNADDNPALMLDLFQRLFADTGRPSDRSNLAQDARSVQGNDTREEFTGMYS